MLTGLVDWWENDNGLGGGGGCQSVGLSHSSHNGVSLAFGSPEASSSADLAIPL